MLQSVVAAGRVFPVRKARNIIEQPRMFIAQEALDFSRYLIFDEESGESDERYLHLRAFAVQSRRREATASPGGLARVSGPDSRKTNISSGGLCKPTWVVR